MRLLAVSAAVLFAGVLAAPLLADEHPPHWGYVGHAGPEHWGELSPQFAACRDGKNQSPVDISAAVDAPLPPLALAYGSAATNVVNNGHTVQFNFAPGSVLKVDGLSFALKQLHFHTPSENHIEGKSYPLEAHLVHASSDGQLAVVAVLYEQGSDNAVLAASWAQLPMQVSEPLPLSAALKAQDLLPAARDYYRYSGSLTTPPCSEGVRWLVMKEHPQISQQQVKHFMAAVGQANNRPLQPHYARQVVE